MYGNHCCIFFLIEYENITFTEVKINSGWHQSRSPIPAVQVNQIDLTWRLKVDLRQYEITQPLRLVILRERSVGLHYFIHSHETIQITCIHSAMLSLETVDILYAALVNLLQNSLSCVNAQAFAAVNSMNYMD